VPCRPAVDGFFTATVVLPDGLSAGLADSFSGAALAFSPDSDLASPPVSLSPARLRLFSLSDLKSVSYQPPPLRRNTGAEISRFSLFLPQAGHLRSGLSVTFCSSSW
jgi:hypothetical protein